MKKFINDPEHIVKELLEGFVLANAKTVAFTDPDLIVRANPKPLEKVALITIGGSGHEPALSGYVGPGMLDISVPGEIFAAPGPPRVIEALRLANREAGVLFVVLNHEGDVMTANIAMEMAQQEGLNVAQVLTHEDISAPSRETSTPYTESVCPLNVCNCLPLARSQTTSLLLLPAAAHFRPPSNRAIRITEAPWL